MAAAAAAPAARGRLRIADRVYARLAEQAVRQALADEWARRSTTAAPPRASVLVVGGNARITLHLELPYPADLAELSRIARDAVADHVSALTGTPVLSVAVLVERLVPAVAS
ncbi:hypothetical protein [Kitasatospora sp. NPDC059571]|uniref:hypothetical protein n=1 Tax=Kitasatospora sp. NPDC059571 TaxID=3346871 RepID=UPI0036A39F85